MSIFSSIPEGIDCCSTAWPIDMNISSSANAAAASATAAEVERLQEDYLISNTR